MESVSILKNYLQTNKLYPWLVLVNFTIGTFMVVLDTTIVNVAIPRIMAAFGTSVNKIEWVATAYLLSMAIAMTTVTWLLNYFGARNLYIGSLALFTLGSALCGMAANVDSLNIYRALQGIGAGTMQPIAMVIIFETFPPQQRGLALGIFSIGVTLAPALGPTLGGYLVDNYHWSIIFLINVPVGLFGILLTLVVMQNPRRHANKLAFDFPGFVTLAVFLTTLLVALSRGQRDGWDSDYIRLLLGLALVTFPLFILMERRHSEPLIDFKLFGGISYTSSMIMVFIFGITFFGTTFLLPLMLQNPDLFNFTAFQSGLLLLPGSLFTGLMLTLSGWMADRWDARITIIPGLIVLASTLLLFSGVDPRTSYSSLLWLLIVNRGLGMGLIFTPLMRTALQAVPPQRIGMASGLLNITRQIGGSFGIAMLSTHLEAREVFHESILFEGANLGSTGTKLALLSAKSTLATQGLTGNQLENAAAGILKNQLISQAAMASFQDTFLVISVVAALCLIPALFLRKQ